MKKQKLLKLLWQHHHQLTLAKGDSKNSLLVESGFSLLEVLISIIVVTAFLLGSLQSTVLSTLLRVQALDKQQSANWVQQDLEMIRFEAFRLDRDKTNSDGDPDTKYITQFNPPNTNACGTYGEELQKKLLKYPPSSTIKIENKDYVVTRTYVNSGNRLEINYLVKYASTHPRYKSGADNEVTSLSTEVIPNAALSCS